MPRGGAPMASADDALNVSEAARNGALTDGPRGAPKNHGKPDMLITQMFPS